MKKLSSIAIVAMFAALALTSCKKDYTCTCTIHDSSGIIADTSFSTVFPNQKKDDAKSACDNGDAVLYTVTYSCELD